MFGGCVCFCACFPPCDIAHGYWRVFSWRGSLRISATRCVCWCSTVLGTVHPTFPCPLISTVIEESRLCSGRRIPGDTHTHTCTHTYFLLVREDVFGNSPSHLDCSFSSVLLNACSKCAALLCCSHWSAGKHRPSDLQCRAQKTVQMD